MATLWRIWRTSAFARVGMSVLGVVAIAALTAPLIAPYSVDTIDVWRQLEGPSADHWLGTDENGRDLLSLILHGSRTALLVGTLSVVLSLGIGIFVGALSAWRGGWIDEVFMRLTDIVLAFPGILLAILIIFLTAEPTIWSVVLALSVTGWAGYARLIRGEVMALRRREYVEAARAMGLRDGRILVGHVLPNAFGPIMVQATFGMAAAILAEAALSFLGLGPQDVPSWGALLDQGALYFLLTPHLAIFPGLAIMITVLGINFLGDGLRDVFDPRQKD